MSNSEIISKIVAWLEEEQEYDFKLESQLPSSESFHATIMQGNNQCHIIIPNKTSDVIHFQSKIKFDKKSYGALKPDARLGFIFKLQHSLLLLGVTYEFLPDLNTLEELKVERTIYAESIHKQSFFDAANLVLRASQIAYLHFSWDTKVR